MSNHCSFVECQPGWYVSAAPTMSFIFSSRATGRLISNRRQRYFTNLIEFRTRFFDLLRHQSLYA